MVNVWDCLRSVPDPEIPVVDVVSMGIVREVEESPDGVKVTITPTYSGCPAMSEIEASIRAALHEAGYAQVELKTQIAPAWTTDWITDEACEQLRSYGIAPPERRYASGVAGNSVACPFCASEETRLQSEFGSTLCKALHVCNDCRQPFERFKCI
ncbi:MAG TPA: phenylacetate-CoA oxygenase subunit PaaJ [Deltaproteobacteria bacterium]|jgi:ring-1,2-phenylacetyl-CoA epoxidase subunit PaaD|nr:phenylacetate-CoA oxygenase subunit PaaJ [Deltaproteobacteria bacterium]|tara:strand:+ start:1459 stop:1923 length:465 start_codon:yes stop_codon:yes gene_type:complete